MEQFEVSIATVRQDCLDAGARLSLIKKHSLSLSLARSFYLFLPPSGFETVTKPESAQRDVRWVYFICIFIFLLRDGTLVKYREAPETREGKFHS